MNLFLNTIRINGEMHTMETSKEIPSGSIISMKKEKSGIYSFNKMKLDENWEELSRSKQPVFISKGSPNGMTPSCIGCRLIVLLTC